MISDTIISFGAVLFVKDANYKETFLKLFKVIVIVLIFVAIFLLLFFVVSPYLLALAFKPIEDEMSEANNFVTALSAVVNLILSAGLTKAIESVIEHKLFLPESVPEIVIAPLSDNPNNLSGTKRVPNIQQGMHIKLGDEGPRCRLAYARIKNVGQRTISSCVINCQRINALLEPSQEKEIIFVIYTSGPEAKQTMTYDLKYQIQDSRGGVYKGEYHMQLNESLTQASFAPLKKLRRRVFGNALSDMR